MPPCRTIFTGDKTHAPYIAVAVFFCKAEVVGEMRAHHITIKQRHCAPIFLK